MLTVHLHLTEVCLRSCPHYTGSTLHTHPHAHKTGHRSCCIGTCCLHATSHRSLHITFPYCRIRKHSSLISHIDELCGFLIIGNARNSYRCNLHTTVLLPLLIQNIRHVFAKFPPFGCNKGNPDTICRHLINGRLQGFQKFIQKLLIYIRHFHLIHISRNNFRIKSQWIGNTNRIGSMRPQKQLCIIKVIKIVDRISRTEFNTLDFLQIQVIHLLLCRGLTTILHTLKCRLHCAGKISVKQRRFCSIVHFKVTWLCGVINDFPSIGQDHKLIIIYMDH